MTRILTNRIIWVYYLVFYIIWSLVEQFVKPWLGIYFDGWELSLLKNGVIKPIIWILPSVWLIKRYEKVLFIQLKEMFTNRVKWHDFVPLLVLFTTYNLVGCYILTGTIEISSSFNYSSLITVLFVGVTEELVFRGWLLNAMLMKQRHKVAILINAFMFLMIHFPKFMQEGMLVRNFLNGGFLCIFVLSIIFSISFIKSKNLVVSILLHMYWDLLVFLLIM